MALKEHPLKEIFRRLTGVETNKIEMQTTSNEDGTAIKFSDGTLICYGRFDITKDIQNKVITFPEKFINANYTVTFTNVYTYSVNIVYTIGGKHNTDMTVYPRNPAENAIPIYDTRADYMAIGKWK